MALFIGGPADGWRIDISPADETVDIPINPHPPAFTPDRSVLDAVTEPTYTYKREIVRFDTGEGVPVYIPLDWNTQRLFDELLMGYKVEKNRERLRYVRTAEGTLYDTDDRLTAGRIYKI